MTSVEEIESIVKPLLLTDLTFMLENKRIKSGKLLLFSVRDFFCVFTFFDEVKNKKTIYEIPYPFAVYKEEQNTVFDYTLPTFCEKGINIMQTLAQLNFAKKPAKLYNKKLFVYSEI
jgi:hypothetical protein